MKDSNVQVACLENANPNWTGRLPAGSAEVQSASLRNPRDAEGVTSSIKGSYCTTSRH